MIGAIALLCLVAAVPTLGDDPWVSGLSSKFGINPLHWGSSVFVPLPRTCKVAEKSGWISVTGPTKTTAYASLTLWIDASDPTVGILCDKNNQTAGMQISIPCANITSYYDMVKQGFSLWNATINEETVDYWAIQQYFLTEDAIDTVVYNETEVLRSDYLVVEGIDGELMEIPVNPDDLDSIWTEEACVPLMGRHYYYNMTTTLSCDDVVFPWFPVYHLKTKQLIGTGFMLLTSSTFSNFENPTQSEVEYIVPVAPDCLYELVGTVGVITLHTYYINTPWLVTC